MKSEKFLQQKTQPMLKVQELYKSEKDRYFGIVTSNVTWGMDIYLRSFPVWAALCKRGP
jgi:hypothetical protein